MHMNSRKHAEQNADQNKARPKLHLLLQNTLILYNIYFKVVTLRMRSYLGGFLKQFLVGN